MLLKLCDGKKILLGKERECCADTFCHKLSCFLLSSVAQVAASFVSKLQCFKIQSYYYYISHDDYYYYNY